MRTNTAQLDHDCRARVIQKEADTDVEPSAEIDVCAVQFRVPGDHESFHFDARFEIPHFPRVQALIPPRHTRCTKTMLCVVLIIDTTKQLKPEPIRDRRPVCVSRLSSANQPMILSSILSTISRSELTLCYSLDDVPTHSTVADVAVSGLPATMLEQQVDPVSSTV